MHIIRRLLLATAVIASLAVNCAAQQTPPVSSPVRSAYSDFFEFREPPRDEALFFLGGFRSDKYATTQEGFQLEHSITPYISLVARLTGYQLFEGEGFANPLDPGDNQHRARLNFGRVQGGLDITPYPATHLFLLGGGDFGDSSAGVLEADFSSWWFSYSRHPINFGFEAGYDGQNKVTSTAIDLRTVLLSRGNFLILGGAGGDLYKGGFISGVQAEGGPDLGIFLTRWRAGADFQTGYGNAKYYLQLSMFKLLGWNE
jgi:hypothetical protein